MSNPQERPWWAKEESAAQPPAPRYRAVAYYRHSAKDRQENSVAIQQELVTKWAEENGVDIIHEFADRGKSGLTAEGREGFTDMINNWVKKRDDFNFVLCLDVSRWGRFQDIDLSATYSAECKKHGKEVIYTTLGMPRPDDPLTSDITATTQAKDSYVREAQGKESRLFTILDGLEQLAKDEQWRELLKAEGLANRPALSSNYAVGA